MLKGSYMARMKLKAEKQAEKDKLVGPSVMVPRRARRLMDCSLSPGRRTEIRRRSERGRLGRLVSEAERRARRE
jgi:hypothetical protein